MDLAEETKATEEGVSSENSSESCGPGKLNSQLLIFSKVSLLIKYIQSSPFGEYMGTLLSRYFLQHSQMF